MRKHPTWSYDHYVPIFGSENEIYVCHIVPGPDSFTIEYKTRENEEYLIYYRMRNNGDFILSGKTKQGSYTVSGLEYDTEYEFYVSGDGRRSATRLVRCGESFGSVVGYLHPEDKYYVRGGQYLSCPSILLHPNGYILASFDLFGGNEESARALVYRSDDDGKSWYHTCDLFPAYSPKLFMHRGETYILGCSHAYGNLMISKMLDDGKTFSEPTIIMYGVGSMRGAAHPGIHKMIQPVVEHAGRIWASMEWGCWSTPNMLAPFVVSAPSDSDLMKAESWCSSEPIVYDPSWEGTSKRMNMLKNSFGTLENCLVSVGDKLISVARYEIEHCYPFRGRAIVYEVNTDDPEAKMSFKKVIDHPGNHSKFTIKYDPKRKKYLSLVNPLYTPANADTRNLVTLLSSDDCMEWKTERVVYDYTEYSADKVGVQYIDFEIVGDEIYLLARVGMNGADSYHNSNYIIFDKISID